MIQDQEEVGRSKRRQLLLRLFSLNIRGKIVVPYLALTVVVAIIGTYVVTSLVAGSLDERLTNHLLEAGRVVSDSLARQEMGHLQSARLVAFTRGLAEALEAHDQDAVVELAQPAAVARGVEFIIVVDADGQVMLHMLQLDDGGLSVLANQFNVSELAMVDELLQAGDPNARPRRGIGLHPISERTYYLTAIPVALEGDVVGVVAIGTSLDRLASDFESTALAHVVLYLEGGRVAATSFALLGEEGEASVTHDDLAIEPELYEEALGGDETTIAESIRIRGRWYRFARGPLRVGEERLGVFAVALPLQFVVRAGATSRNTYAVLFTVAVACVVVVGYVISRRITRPLSRLVVTSRAVAEGNLTERTGLGGGDEIGLLAVTFDEMTGRLEQRTCELEDLLQIHKETASRLQAILSSIGDGVMLEDLEGSFIPLNAAAEAQLAEMSSGFLLGPLRELSAEEEDWVSDPRLSPWLLERRRFQVGKNVISVHSAAVRTDDGERLGSVIVLRDVTAEAEADQLKDAFITHVSHELRTPLTAIQGYSKLLLSRAGDSLDGEQRGFLETIGRHTDSLVEMIGELLDFSEMQAAGRVGLRRRPVLLSTIVEKVANEWRAKMDEKGLALQLEVPAGLPLVNVDGRRLRWAVVNLVRNAWQYTPSGGEVTLRLSAHDDRVVLDIADTGLGIAPEDQQLIFDRFYRVERETGDGVRGLGLGLYVTKTIIEAHGGEIRVASEEGVGSTFSVILPAVHDTEGEDSAA